MNRERQVYLLDPQQLPPETIAVTFAKTSRSPESFREIAAELTTVSSAEFNEKWVVGYGHSSVAEHAVLHIAMENISRLAVETIESNRLASYTEKSTRYQTWAEDAFYTPAELDNHPLADIYAATCSNLFSTYKTCLQTVGEHLKSTTQALENETEAQWNRRIRSQSIDACRFLLPASSLANVGMTVNARALEHAVGKMLTSPLMETRQIGEEVKNSALSSIPTLLKYADRIPYLQQVCNEFSSLVVEPQEENTDWCALVHADAGGLDRMLSAAIYREKGLSYTQALGWLQHITASQKEALLNCLLQTPDGHTIPARELEHAFFTFDLLIDQGAYFEVKRHRMMTQTPQSLTASLGYAVPRVISDSGVLAPYQSAMENARSAYNQLARYNPSVASYIVPNGFNRRVLLNLNLRSLVHFVRLRSAPNAHFSVRRAAQRMAEEVGERFPELTTLLGRNENETSTAIETSCFSSTRVL